MKSHKKYSMFMYHSKKFINSWRCYEVTWTPTQNKMQKISHDQQPWCVLLCWVKLLGCLNLFLQILHAYGSSPVCILMWRWRFTFWVNALPHSGQEKGLLTICSCSWCSTSKLLAEWKAQYLHWCISPIICFCAS